MLGEFQSYIETMTDFESNSLIDWSGPVIECINKPLIPLPSFNNPIDIGEDNPFDAVERQINENELLDIFNINLSFNENNDSKCEDQNDLSDIIDCSDNASANEEDNADVFLSDDILRMSSENNKNDLTHLDASIINSTSSLSDFKEMIRSRISCCVNQASHPDSPLKSNVTRSSSDSIESAFSQASELNKCFIEQGEKLVDSKYSDLEFVKNLDTDCEDLLSMKLNWDEYLMSSSDEENEKPLDNNVQKSKICNFSKKIPLKQAERMINVRVPLLCQDPNIRIRKMGEVSKQGPLKATVPLSSMKRIEDRKLVNTNSTARITTSFKSKATTSNQSKLKRWSSPVAASTPHGSQTNTPKSKQSSLSCSSRNSSIQSQRTPGEFSHPPSPDSTSDSKVFSRTNSAVRFTSKNNIKKSSPYAVSSSTNSNLSGTLSKTTKNFRNVSNDATSKVVMKSVGKNARNKENLMPFRN